MKHSLILVTFRGWNEESKIYYYEIRHEFDNILPVTTHLHQVKVKNIACITTFHSLPDLITILLIE